MQSANTKRRTRYRALLIGQVIFYSLFSAVWFVGNLIALHFLADARVTMIMCWGMLCYMLAWIAGGLGRLTACSVG